MAGVVVVPWYSTGFRAERFAADLSEVAGSALRYGATSYAVYRSRTDKYRFQQFSTFGSKLDWERYWEGPEMTYFRTVHSSWYQVPVLYDWWDLESHGATDDSELVAGNGRGNGHGRPVGDVS
ncbi:MAG TPA: hypothetical protein VMB91_13710 [Solirubrobacteraceae bacterium]|nr:hypothetical protein [Solirubrobacteraceae bacterium]